MSALNEQLATPGRKWTLAAVVRTALGAGVSFGAVVPLLSLNLQQRGFDAAEIGINAAMAPLGAVCFSFLVPRVVARLGIFNSIVASAISTASLILLFPAIDGYGAWCAIRAAIGCIGVVHWIAS